MNLRNLVVLAAGLAASATAAEFLVYAGTSTDGNSRGIYAYRFDSTAAKLKSLGLKAPLANPTSLVGHPDHRFLYAVSENTPGTVSAFLIEPKNGKLTLVNSTSSKGDGPCALSLDRAGKWLAVANCTTGGVAVLPLRKDGGLGDAQAFLRPELPHQAGAERTQSHPRSLVFSTENRFLLVADYGLNRIYVYRFDPDKGSLTPADPPFVAAAPGAGVTGLVVHPNGRILYALNETFPSVTAYRLDPATGGLSDLQTVSTLPPAYTGAGAAAAIAINTAGTMVYASNRGLDSMALLVVDPVKFTLSALEFTPLIGQAPRHFAIDPTGAFMLVSNQESGNISLYSVHPRSGQLRPVGHPAPNIDKPAALVFVPVE